MIAGRQRLTAGTIGPAICLVICIDVRTHCGLAIDMSRAWGLWGAGLIAFAALLRAEAAWARNASVVWIGRGRVVQGGNVWAAVLVYSADAVAGFGTAMVAMAVFDPLRTSGGWHLARNNPYGDYRKQLTTGRPELLRYRPPSGRPDGCASRTHRS